MKKERVVTYKNEILENNGRTHSFQGKEATKNYREIKIKKIYLTTFPSFFFEFLLTFRSITEERPIISKFSNFVSVARTFNLIIPRSLLRGLSPR